MTDKENAQQGDHLSVRLNEAFERLEKQHQENLSSPASGLRASSNGHGDRRSSSVAGVLGILLSLIGIGIASYAAWTVYVQTHRQAGSRQLETRLDALDRRADENQSQLNALSKQVGSLSTSVAGAETANKQDLDQLQKQVQASIAQIRANLGTSSKDWIYAEVEYLLRLANQRVIMEGNVKGALTLFHDADNIIRQSEGVTAFDLRRAIADNIAQLEAVSEVDVDGIYVRLSALSDQATRLRQRQLVFKPNAPAPGHVAPGAGVTARTVELLKRAATRLVSLVDFRRNSEPVRPILPPKEIYYLHQNLVLKIQMAQLALLRGDEPVYQRSLDEARAWVKAHFDPQDQATMAMSKDLLQLSAIDIAQKMPDVTSSLKEVRKLMASFHAAPSRNEQAK